MLIPKGYKSPIYKIFCKYKFFCIADKTQSVKTTIHSKMCASYIKKMHILANKFAHPRRKV